MTWGEVIARSGIFRNQVVEQLKLIRRSSDDFEVHLLSGIPIVNMKLLRSPRAFWREMRQFRENLSAEGVAFHIRMIPSVSAWFYSKRWQFPLYRLFNSGYLKRYARRHAIDVVHCRSYQATYFALTTRDKYGLGYKVIFDTRGLFPEEGVVKNFYRVGGPEYAFCKGVEKFCLRKADKVVNVSETFSGYIRSVTDNPNIETIYTSTNLELFRLDPGVRLQTRNSLGIGDTERILVYLGDIRTSGWHQVSNLARVYRAFSMAFPATRLLVITEQDHSSLLANLAKLGVEPQSALIQSGSGQVRINALLNAGDYACLPFRDVDNDIERLLGYTMIASKTGEYLAAGLPVLSNALVGAASALIRKEGLGAVYHDDGKAVRFENMDWAEPSCLDGMKDRAARIAQSLFSASVNARKYGEIYRQLTCSPS